MKRASYVSVPAMAILLLTSSISSMVAAGEAKNTHYGRGWLISDGREATANKKAQWSADPKQGWVRTDESHRTQDGQKSSTSAKRKMETTQGNGKQKGNKIK